MQPAIQSLRPRKSTRDCKDYPWEAWIGIAILQVSSSQYSVLTGIARGRVFLPSTYGIYVGVLTVDRYMYGVHELVV